MTRAALTMATVLVVAAQAGCGDSGNESGPTSPSKPTTAELTFVFEAERSAVPKRVTLACPASDAASRSACRELERVPAETFDPIPPNKACTEIYGGPQTLQVSGQLGEATIESEFSRVNGCEISRWGSLSPVLESLGLGPVGVALPR